jgi:hypothetical protein
MKPSSGEIDLRELIANAMRTPVSWKEISEAAWAQVRCGRCMRSRGHAPLLGWKMLPDDTDYGKATSRNIRYRQDMDELRCPNCHTYFTVSPVVVDSLEPTAMMDRQGRSRTAIYLVKRSKR